MNTAPLRFEIPGRNLTYTLKPPLLLPVADDAIAMGDSADQVVASASIDTDPRSCWRATSLAGFMFLCAGRTQLAIDLLEECVSRQNELGDSAAAQASRLRLVQALQASGQLEYALTLARTAVTLAAPEALHFALHHLGKVLLQGGQHHEAREVLERALRMRKSMDDASLALSTEVAIALLQA